MGILVYSEKFEQALIAWKKRGAYTGRVSKFGFWQSRLPADIAVFLEKNEVWLLVHESQVRDFKCYRVSSDSCACLAAYPLFFRHL